MPAIDRFDKQRIPDAGMGAPFTVHEAVTAHDTNELTYLTVALFVGVGGTIVCVTEDGTSVSYTVPDGFILPGRFKQVKATGTTATNIVAWS